MKWNYIQIPEWLNVEVLTRFVRKSVRNWGWILLLTATSAAQVQAQVFEWADLGLSDGQSIDQNSVITDAAGITMTVSWTNTTDNQVENRDFVHYSTVRAGGLGSSNVRMEFDGNTNEPIDHRVTLTLDFSQPVANLRFRLNDLDSIPNSYPFGFIDTVEIFAADDAAANANKVNLKSLRGVVSLSDSVVNNTGKGVNGWRGTGWSNMDKSIADESRDANLHVDLSGQPPTSQIVINYFSNRSTRANPGPQHIHVGDIGYTNPDFGDAPNRYQTLSSTAAKNGGPEHVFISQELKFGDSVDGEPNGQPNVNADGDDTNGLLDDEDGVMITTNHLDAIISANTLVTNTQGHSINVCGWLDINVDGDFADTNEKQCMTTTETNFVHSFEWKDIDFSSSYTTYARFRVTRDEMVSDDNAHFRSYSYGEVEDYAIPIAPGPTDATVSGVDLDQVIINDILDTMSRDTLLALLASYDRQLATQLAKLGSGTAQARRVLTAYLDPDGDGKVVILNWQTLEERGTIGFYAERDNGDGWTRVSTQMLPGLINAPLGGEYRLFDPGASNQPVYRYRLIELNARGRQRVYGPWLL